MNYYHMPAVPGLEADVTLCNFAPVSERGEKQDSYSLYAASPHDDHWKIESLGLIEAGETVRFGRHDLSSLHEERLVVLFMYNESLSDTLNSLPTNPILNSSPAWRSNIRLASETTAVSYQGEYPDSMLSLSKGTLASICPLVQTSEGTSTILIFTNLLADPARKAGTLLFARLGDKRIIHTAQVETNSSNLVDLTGLESIPEDPVCVFSRDLAGVPVYVSFSPGYRHLSLEHSHPPVELLVFGEIADRFAVMRNAKDHWLNVWAARS